MDLLGPSINAAVVAIAALLLWWYGRGRFDALDRRIDRLEERLIGTEIRLDGRIDAVDARFDGMEARSNGLEARIDRRFDGVDARFDGLEVRIDGGFDVLQASMDAMRSDLTQVALAVGVRPRAQND